MFEPDIIVEKEEKTEMTNQNMQMQISAPVATFNQASYPVHTIFIAQPIRQLGVATDVEMPFVDTYPDFQLNDVAMNHFLESNDLEMDDPTQSSTKSMNSFMAPEDVFLTCGQCNKSFETKEEMFKHYVVHDMANDPIKCATCDKEFVRRQYLQMHAMMHARPKRFQCTYCPKSFRAKRDMDDHIRTHTGEKPFACEYCDRKFRVRKQLYAHRKLHVQAFQCSKCKASFSIEWSLKRHEKLCLQQDAPNALVAALENPTPAALVARLVPAVQSSIVIDDVVVKEENDPVKQEIMDQPNFPETIVTEFGVSGKRPDEYEVLKRVENSSIS